jgi:hypothetical protein
MQLSINVPEILSSMESYLVAAYTKDSPAVKQAIATYTADAAQRLADVASGTLSGELTGAEVLKSVKEEALNLKDQLESIGEIVGADLQELASNALNIFTGTLMDAVIAK